MQLRKIIQAVNRDRVCVEHPTLDLSNPMSTFISVRHDGVSHLVVSSPAPNANRLGMTTAQFSVSGHDARIVESVDTNHLGASSVRYEGILEAPTGALWVQSYDSADHAIALLSALDPKVNELGITIGANNRIDFASPAEVLLEVADLGVLQINPLTVDVIDQLPDWQGTPVDGGHLYAGSISRSLPMLTLVTETARINILPGEDPDMDALTEHAAALRVAWTP